MFNVLINNSDTEDEINIEKKDIEKKDIIKKDIEKKDKKINRRKFIDTVNNVSIETNSPWTIYKSKKNISTSSENKYQKYDIKKRNFDVDINQKIFKDDEIIKKKSFTGIVKEKCEIKLPAYYQIRSHDNTYEIPQYESAWIKKIGGLEKSENTEMMFKGVILYAVSYYENSNYMNKNQYFIGKKSIDNEELLELILIQTFSILFHRSIKSDTVDIIKIILGNLPNYRIISGNPLENTPLVNTNGALLYQKIKSKWIKLNRNLINARKNEDNDKINEYTSNIKSIETKWMNYITQSIWNGNNPIHDCLYYGSSMCFDYILEYCYEKNLYDILMNMMSISNGQNESHKDIVYNGKKSCEKDSSYIIRKIHYSKCEILYNKTIELLQSKKNNLLVDEFNDNNMNDNINVIDMLMNKDDNNIINYIINYSKLNQYDIIIKTFKIWDDMAKNNNDLLDYLSNIKKLSELSEVINKIDNNDIIIATNIFMKQNIDEIITYILNLIKEEKYNLINNIFNEWNNISKTDEDLLNLLEDIKYSNELSNYVDKIFI